MFESDNDFLIASQGVLRLGHLFEAFRGVGELLDAYTHTGPALQPWDRCAVIRAWIPPGPRCAWPDPGVLVSWEGMLTWSDPSSRCLQLRLFSARCITSREIDTHRRSSGIRCPGVRCPLSVIELSDEDAAQVYCFSLRMALRHWSSHFPECGNLAYDFDLHWVSIFGWTHHPDPGSSSRAGPYRSASPGTITKLHLDTGSGKPRTSKRRPAAIV
jgi:hypothetical protein